MRSSIVWSWMKPRSRLILVFASLVVCLWLISSRSHEGSTCDLPAVIQPSGVQTPGAKAIDGLIHDAEKTHDQYMQKTTPSLEKAVKAYRARRGRPPPPGFDKWHKRATLTRSIVEEGFFDQIYEDLEPFWGVDVSTLHESYAGWEWTIEVRDGKVDAPSGRFRSRTWANMIRELANELPDMDVPINPLDEPRIFAPWHVVNESVTKAAAQRERMSLLADNQLLTRTSKPSLHQSPGQSALEWITDGAIWPHILATCPSSALEQIENSATLPKGNWTASKDICTNQHVANFHGFLIEPASMSITKHLVPIFSTAKIQGNNDILLPAPSYYSDDYLFTGRGFFGDGATSVSWHKKIHGLLWRGKATGGNPNHPKVQDFHRHRLVSLLNASQTDRFVSDPSILWPENVKTTTNTGQVSAWLRKVSNAAFTDLFLPTTPSSTSLKIRQNYNVAQPVSMREMYTYKYLPDIDGNSLSGRFRAFLRSNSAPLKATIFKEWHDHRLIPWAHFIPIDITLRDLWSTMAYFLGFGDAAPPRDAEGARIACHGRSWAERALRREDMLVYAHRVLLEWARVGDDERDRLGFSLVSR